MSELRREWVQFLGAIALGLLLALMLEGAMGSPHLWAQTALEDPEFTAPVAEYNLFQAAVLGIVQGLTEFLPISSTAHLNVVPRVLGWGKPGVTFEAIIQLGSIAAVLWYFWGDLKQLTTGAIAALRKSDYRAPELRMVVGILVGTLPIVVCGLLLKAFVDLDNTPLRGMSAIALASIVMALLLGLAEWVGTRKRSFDKLNAKDGIWMGVAQTLALIPGVSRSGSTITAGLFMGLERATAARFSFLLGIPAITLAGLVELKEVIDGGLNAAEVAPLIVGVITAVISSYVAIAGLIRYLQRQNTWVFVWYRLLFGVFVLGAIALGRV